MECDELKEEAESDRRRYQLVRERLARSDDPAQWTTFEDMMEEFGLDPDGDGLEPRSGDKKP